MAVGDLKYNTNNRASSLSVKHWHTFVFSGDLVDSATEEFRVALPYKGRLTDIQGSLEDTGTVSGNASFDVKNAGTSMLTTLGDLTFAAANGALTRVGGAGGTGITDPVIDATQDNVVEDAIVTVELVTSAGYTAQPRNATITLEFTEEQDFDPAL